MLIMSIIKQTKPAKHMTHRSFHRYNKEPKIRAASHPAEYLKRTKGYKDTEKFFSTCIKPCRAPSKNDISSWRKSIIKESGTSIYNYISNLSRATDLFYVKSCGASLSTIIQDAG